MFKDKLNFELCNTQLYEISKRNISGYRNVKLILHEIFPDNSQWQKNGISWNEKYTQANLDSIIGMSLRCEFTDESRTVPLGHGETGINENNLPIFENADVVGNFYKAYITDIELDGKLKRVCMAEARIDAMCYPNFIKWLEKNLVLGTVEGSVEIVGKPENDNVIIYDGGWKEEGRVPQEYVYSGHAILSVPSADDSAIVLELNKKQEGKKEVNDMELEKAVSEIKEAFQSAINELNTKLTASDEKVNELNNTISEKEGIISEKETELSTKVTELEKKNAEIEELKTEKETVSTELEVKKTELETLTTEINELRKDKKVSEVNTLLSKYSKEELSTAKDEIEQFQADPLNFEVNTIINKINEKIVTDLKEKKDTTVEINDIFGFVDEPKEKKSEVDYSDIF